VWWVKTLKNITANQKTPMQQKKYVENPYRLQQILIPRSKSPRNSQHSMQQGKTIFAAVHENSCNT
jgi:hypothetical protein